MKKCGQTCIGVDLCGDVCRIGIRGTDRESGDCQRRHFRPYDVQSLYGRRF